MTYGLTIEQKPSYLHVIVTGPNNKQTVRQYMEEVMRECTTRNCKNVLIEERLDGPRLEAFEIFSMVSQGATQFLGALRAMAYVDVNAKGDLMRFAENVAVNRGIPVQIFASVSDAEKWLLHHTRDSE